MATYKISPIDGRSYTVDNGAFTRHLKSQGITYREYLEQYEVGPQVCNFCGAPKSYTPKAKQFGKTCGKASCKSALMKQIIEATPDIQRTKQFKIKQTKQNTPQPIKEEHQHRRNQTLAATLATRGDEIKSMRVQTNVDRHGRGNYNNPTQISKSKLVASDESKAEANAKRLATLFDRHGATSLHDFINSTTWYNRSKKLSSEGRCVDPDERDGWYRYRRNCRQLTEQTYKQYKSLLDPTGDRGANYELDHVIPILEGYLRNIDPSIISSVFNLRMLPTCENRSRSKRMPSEEFDNRYQQLMEAIQNDII